MRFSTFASVACITGLTTAATIPAEIRSSSDELSAPVEKRQILTAVVTALVVAAATEAGTLAVQESVDFAISEVNKIGSDFTAV